MRKTKNRDISRKILFIVIFIILVVIFMPLSKVNIGEKAVVYNYITGEITKNVPAGWHLVLPFMHKMTIYPVNDQTYKIWRDNKNWNNGIDASIITPTSDNQKVSIDATFVYSVNTECLDYIFERFNGEGVDSIEKNYLDNIFNNAVVSVVSQYSAYEVYSTKRVDIQNKILEMLKDEIANNGLILKYVYIDTVRLSEEAEAIIRAQALAEAAIIEAQGKSDANRLLSDSLSDTIMTYEAINQLSKSLQLVVIPSGTGTEIDFSKIIEQVLKQEEDTSE